LNIAGNFPVAYTYTHPAFRENHLALYLFYFSRSDGLHSLLNYPNAVYNQVAGEYGIAGLLCLFFFYFGFFFRRLKKGSHALALLLMLAGLFFTEYWFEQLSIVVFFELLVFLDIREMETASP
jgi:hypothetical protein